MIQHLSFFFPFSPRPSPELEVSPCWAAWRPCSPFVSGAGTWEGKLRRFPGRERLFSGVGLFRILRLTRSLLTHLPPRGPRSSCFRLGRLAFIPRARGEGFLRGPGVFRARGAEVGGQTDGRAQTLPPRWGRRLIQDSAAFQLAFCHPSVPSCGQMAPVRAPGLPCCSVQFLSRFLVLVGMSHLFCLGLCPDDNHMGWTLSCNFLLPLPPNTGS